LGLLSWRFAVKCRHLAYLGMLANGCVA
jgi:hypothetical protein